MNENVTITNQSVSDITALTDLGVSQEIAERIILDSLADIKYDIKVLTTAVSKLFSYCEKNSDKNSITRIHFLFNSAKENHNYGAFRQIEINIIPNWLLMLNIIFASLIEEKYPDFFNNELVTRLQQQNMGISHAKKFEATLSTLSEEDIEIAFDMFQILRETAANNDSGEIFGTYKVLTGNLDEAQELIANLLSTPKIPEEIIQLRFDFASYLKSKSPKSFPANADSKNVKKKKNVAIEAAAPTPTLAEIIPQVTALSNSELTALKAMIDSLLAANK